MFCPVRPKKSRHWYLATKERGNMLRGQRSKETHRQRECVRERERERERKKERESEREERDRNRGTEDRVAGFTFIGTG